MAISLNTQLRQSQKLVMTQALRQQIEMLQLTTQDLIETVDQELEENPVLEIDESQTPEVRSSSDDELDRALSHDIETMSQGDGQTPSELGDYGDDNDRNRSFIENAVSMGESLSEHLVAQIRLLDNSEDDCAIMERIVTSLDSFGFFTVDHEEFSSECGISVSVLQNLLSIVKTLEPIGCGSSGPAEALLVQAKISFPEDLKMHIMLQDHFTELSHLQYERVARSLSVSNEEIIERWKKVQTLNPFPGSGFDPSATRYIVPDMEIYLADGEPVIVFRDEMVPRLRINKEYVAMLAKKDIDKKLKEYIKDRVGSARLLLRNIAGRRDTIEKVVRAVMQHQIGFLQKGPGHLKPLTYSTIAEMADCHESTVGRVSSGKFVQCKWGVFELKYFFTSKIGEESDERSSDEALKLIRDLISREKGDSPYSDEEIAKFLNEAGVNVARRTVAKYRESIGIPSSSKRKRLKLIKYKDGVS